MGQVLKCIMAESKYRSSIEKWIIVDVTLGELFIITSRRRGLIKRSCAEVENKKDETTRTTPNPQLNRNKIHVSYLIWIKNVFIKAPFLFGKVHLKQWSYVFLLIKVTEKRPALQKEPVCIIWCYNRRERTVYNSNIRCHSNVRIWSFDGPRKGCPLVWRFLKRITLWTCVSTIVLRQWNIIYFLINNV